MPVLPLPSKAGDAVHDDARFEAEDERIDDGVMGEQVAGFCILGIGGDILEAGFEVFDGAWQGNGLDESACTIW